jgi:hypothetical protein
MLTAPSCRLDHGPPFPLLRRQGRLERAFALDVSTGGGLD